MIVLGELRSSPEFPYAVGVCSTEGGSESEGEISESGGSRGEATRLRSYSSSASESAWYAVWGNDMLEGMEGLAWPGICQFLARNGFMVPYTNLRTEKLSMNGGSWSCTGRELELIVKCRRKKQGLDTAKQPSKHKKMLYHGASMQDLLSREAAKK